MKNRMEEKEFWKNIAWVQKKRGRIRVKMWRGRVVQNVIGKI